MSVCYQEAKRMLTLTTKSTSYQMKVDQYGILHHLYYGSRLGPQDDMSYLFYPYDRGFSGNPYEAQGDRRVSLDTLPQEYSSYGVGDFRISALSLRCADGSRCADLRYAGHELLPGKYSLPGLPYVYDQGDRAQTLVVTLEDRVTGLEVRLLYGIFEEEDVITRGAQLVNRGREALTLEKAASLCLDLPYGPWELMHFHGRHCMERQMERHPLGHAVETLSSTRGMSSHQHNPFLILCDPACDEDHGDCCGVMLMYSGSHKMEVEQDQFDSVRVVAGIQDEAFSWTLAPGESFYTPETILAYSGEGLAHLSHLYHHLLRHHVCRGTYQFRRRPVLLNSWEASYFDINEEKALSLAREAAGLGIELFVLDDGWFTQRRDDTAGLGDWQVDREKFPRGLAELARQVRELGLDFGLWIEPEMVSERSALYEAHPDWALCAPNRPPMVGRGQLVLDMTREEVREYLYDIISRLIRETGLTYIKWDMNRSLSDVYSHALPPERQGEVSHRYVLGVYELLERLTQDFPQVLFEGCAGGGGRFDAGMLYYTPQIWCSDDTDPIERLSIQYGTSFGYPASAVGAHVSASPNHQTGRSTQLQTRAFVAMSGAFGYELDPKKLTEQERREIRGQIEDYKRYSGFMQDGFYYRLSIPRERQGFDAWQFVSRDRGESLLLLVMHATAANAPLVRVHLKGLDPQAVYDDSNGQRISGAALMRGGYVFPQVVGDYPVAQVHFTRCEPEQGG